MSVVIAMFLFFGGFIMAASSPMPSITSFLLVFMVFWMRFISACSPPISLIFVMFFLFLFIFIFGGFGLICYFLVVNWRKIYITYVAMICR